MKRNNNNNVLERIYSAVLKFLVPSSPDEVYKIIVEEAIKLVNVDAGAIYLRTDNTFKVVYATNPYVYKIEPRKSGNTKKAFLNHKTIIAKVTRFHPELKTTEVKSSIFIPLSYEDRAIGVLTLDSKHKEYFDNKKKSTLVLFGSMASLAIRKAQLYSEVKQSADARDLFISLAAHELRTPLTTISGYIQLLLTKTRHKSPIDPKWIYELALESQRMESLVQEFLEINTIRTGKLLFVFKESKVEKIVKRAISIFGFTRPKRKVTFRNKLDSMEDSIIGDSNKLTQVLVNILENSDKYSKWDKEISITLDYKEANYVLNIVDHGQGISEEDLPKIFKGFYKGKDSLHEGMGLGLYLSKLIIDRHHGTINISSEVGKGTKVVVTLPRAEIVK